MSGLFAVSTIMNYKYAKAGPNRNLRSLLSKSCGRLAPIPVRKPDGTLPQSPVRHLPSARFRPVGSEEARLRAGLRPPPKLQVRISRMQLSRRLSDSRMREKVLNRATGQARTRRTTWSRARTRSASASPRPHGRDVPSPGRRPLHSQTTPSATIEDGGLQSMFLT
jgi:hypothetical protein